MKSPIKRNAASAGTPRHPTASAGNDRQSPMAKKQPKPTAEADEPTPRGDLVSLYPLSPDQALAAFLRVKPAELKRLEEQEAAKKKAAKGKGRKR